MTTGIVEGRRERKNIFAWLVRVVRAWSDSIYIWKRVSSHRECMRLRGGRSKNILKLDGSWNAWSWVQLNIKSRHIKEPGRWEFWNTRRALLACDTVAGVTFSMEITLNRSDEWGTAGSLEYSSWIRDDDPRWMLKDIFESAFVVSLERRRRTEYIDTGVFVSHGLIRPLILRTGYSGQQGL